MRTYEASQVAKYFLARSDSEAGDLLSNLKLQKLCYYAAGIFAAVREPDEPTLFKSSINAWQHGPVVPSLYHEYKKHGAGGIPPETDFDFSVFDEADRKILDDVYNFYGQYSAWKLREMTHGEAPWIDAYGKADDKITPEALRAFFLNEVGESYIASYREETARGQ